MDPCPFFRIRVGGLALKLPTAPSSLFYCKIKLADFPLQTTAVPAFAPDSASAASSTSACFTLSKPDLDRLHSKKKSPGLFLSIDVYRARSKDGSPTGCGIGFGSRSGKFVGRVRLVLDLAQVGLTGLLHNGWVPIADAKSSAELYVSLSLDPDPRFVFEFDGESECSPQVFQVQGNIKQPVFSCNFGFRNSGEWNNLRSGSASASESAKERKGWTVTIHDLSGSPVAAASIATPFVASPGSDRVSRSNPGAWLILRPADGTWNPWGRLEAWSEGSSVAYRFEILSAAGGITLSTGEFSARSGGRFAIDIPGPFFNSPISTPSSSFDLGSECGSGSGSGWCWGPQWMYRGFVMSSTVGEERAQVQVGAQHVTCAEDAAVFVALAAAADLSVDACRPFSHKLRKELRPPTGEVVV